MKTHAFSIVAAALLGLSLSAQAANSSMKPREFDRIFDGMTAGMPTLTRGEIAATVLLAAKTSCPQSKAFKRVSEDRILASMLGKVDPQSTKDGSSPEIGLRNALLELYRAQPGRATCRMPADEVDWLIEEMATVGPDHLNRGATAAQQLKLELRNEKSYSEWSKPPKKSIEQQPKAWYRHYFPDYAFLSATPKAASYRAFSLARSNSLGDEVTLAHTFLEARCKGFGMALERTSRVSLEKPADAFDQSYAYACAQLPAARVADVAGKKRGAAAAVAVSQPPVRFDVDQAFERGARFSGQLEAGGVYTGALKLGTLNRADAHSLVQLALHDGIVNASQGCKSGRADLRTLEFWLLNKDAKNDVALKMQFDCEAGAK